LLHAQLRDLYEFALEAKEQRAKADIQAETPQAYSESKATDKVLVHIIINFANNNSGEKRDYSIGGYH
jgi:hypothetical protein